MSTEKDAAFYERSDKVWLSAWNEGQLDALDEIYAPNFVRHQPPFPDVVGLEAYKKYIAGVRASYPDFHLTRLGGISQGDFSATRGVATGTKAGESVMTTATGTGQKIEFGWVSYAHWEGDKIAEEWSYSDYLTMVAQLGLIPPLKEIFRGGG